MTKDFNVIFEKIIDGHLKEVSFTVQAKDDIEAESIAIANLDSGDYDSILGKHYRFVSLQSA